ncbi:basic amino acid ABC transporter substrate-binding protein [Halothermothrix orenii]|uniref:Extracellular solute-binding protein family 3 n=1 Tax=Halothermothrix orenii (strain H 168 / OCM 544 / DSM 9562) TaxID=373903 RepID=B8CZA7_HALOH|nr:basic amino acid ABC transporter substrate-binding protein [Halothermothrix orenii]ACL70626.1 extracellular solute-binding protein family 3 [Halothermothrix orenii H 168]
MKKLSIILVTLLLVMLAGIGVSAEKYVVGTSADFPPFEYVEDGEFVGFDMDLIRAIAEVEGFEVEIRDMSFDSLIAALKSGNIDIAIAGMTITEKREKVVDFSIPYYTANQSVIVKEDSDLNLTVLYGDNNVGVQTSTTGDLWVTDNLEKKGILTGKVVRYDTFVLAVTDLVNGNLDAIVLDSPVAERFVDSHPLKEVGIIITGEEYGIVVNEGNKDLLNKINNGIKKLQESGVISKLVGKYFK